jgi:hypothetical protein
MMRVHMTVDIGWLALLLVLPCVPFLKGADP